MRLREDLGADWLDRLELLIVLEERMTEFDINTAPDKIETVGDLMRAIEDAAEFARPRGMTEPLSD
jgi:acyl carrier protein